MQKILFSLLLLWAIPFAANAQKRVPSTIKEVTLYRNGAKLTSTAKVSLSAGSNEIIFEKLPVGTEPSSLQVRLGGNKADLMSAFFRANTIETIKPDYARILILNDSIVLVNDQLARIASEVSLLQTEESLIIENQKRVGTGTPVALSVSDYQQLITYYRTRVGEIKERRLALDIERRKQEKKVADIQKRISLLSRAATETAGEIVLQIESAIAQQIDIACIYLIYGASWTPQYDLRAESTEKPLQLVYKAAVYQNSGFDWSGIKLRLSPAQPLVNNSRPILGPQYINYRIVQAPGAPAPMAEQRDLSRASYLHNAMQTPAELDAIQEVVFAPENEPETPAFIEVFEITALQTIRNGESNQIIRYKEQEIQANYEYHAVPKLDPSVFLLAKIPDYGKYGLLSGNAQIFFKDTYIGQSMIDLKTVSDTLLLSLGRDEDITIKRIKPTDVSFAPKFFGTSKKETFTYDIVVKNNKSIPIAIEILDQIPVSRQADIVVELEEKGGASYQKDYGRLLWHQKIPAYKNAIFRFSYTIKYPKEKQVAMN